MSQPRNTVRAEAQRARILDAARRCFSERGFHGASIAAIADTAGMSQGLIYRYFTNKAAIIRAITDAQREGRAEALSTLADCGPLVDKLLDKIDAWRRQRDSVEGEFDPALFLEVTAEATRDADIAAVVSAQEQSISDDFAELVQRSAAARGRPLDADALAQRTVLVRCLIDGMILSCVRDPAADNARLRTSLRQALQELSL